MAAYRALLERAGNVANTPWTPYSGEFVAPINAQQQLAGQNINQFSGFAMPFIGQARQYATEAAAPISGSDINRYLSPYTQDVIDRTEAQFNRQNQQQLANVRGNAIAQGALGGDREGVAEAETTNAQNLAQAPVIAGLYNQGYNTALSTALQEQQARANAAYSLGNLGVAGQNAALQGANAQMGYGTLQQSTQQALDQALYQQFLAQMGFPFQETQWLAGLQGGIGSLMGGTSSTTGPAPNPWSSWLGLGLGALSLSDRHAKTGVQKIGETKDGQPLYRFRYKGDPEWHIGLIAQDVERHHPEAVKKIAGFGGLKFLDLKAATDDSIHRDSGGRIAGFAMGGMPYEGGFSYIPSIAIPKGSGPPAPPGVARSQDPDPFKLASSSIDLGKKLKGLGLGSSFGSGDVSLGEAQQAGLESGLDPDEVGIGIEGAFLRGGRIAGFAAGGSSTSAHYADGGGDDSFEDRWNPLEFQDERIERALGLGDVTGRYPVPDQDVPLPRARPRSTVGDGGDYVNPLRVNGQAQNLTGDIIPPGGTGGAPTEEPSLAGPQPIAGLGEALMNFAPGRGVTRGYVPVPGTAGAPSVPSDDGKQAGFGGLLKIFNNPLGLSDNVRQGLLAAGLGMMASRSPFLANAIGEGGLAGLSAYTGSKKEEFNEDKALKTLEETAKQHADRLALNTKQLDALEVYRKQQLQNAKDLMDIRRQGAESGKYSFQPGPGPGPDGNTVQGAWRFDQKGGEPKFFPGVTPAPKGGAAAAVTPEEQARIDLRRDIAARRLIAGDISAKTNVGRGAQGSEELKAMDMRAAEILTDPNGEYKYTPSEAARFLAEKSQEYKAGQVGKSAEARTAATREANLNIILKAADAAVPAALEASERAWRTGFVPLNRIIQHGQVMVSNPELKEFGMANLQLAEHWARAMNPTGVMRESDRDKALEFLSTADSPETYRRAVMQLQKQITRERDAIASTRGGGAAPGVAGPAAGGATPGAGGTPVHVTTPAEAQALAPGTRYVTPDGKVYVR